MKKILCFILGLAMLLMVFSCKIDDPDDNIPAAGWTYITGYNFPIFTAKFGGVMSTSADGDLLGFMEVGDSTGFDDADDWVIQIYEADKKEQLALDSQSAALISAPSRGR